MMNSNQLGTTVGLLFVLTLGACGTMNDAPYAGGNAPSSTATTGRNHPGSNNPSDTYPNQSYAGYGVVHSIERVSQEPTAAGGSGIGLGTVAGAVVGGLVGSQVGGGSGRTAATLIGAAGGAYVGHQVENRPQQAQAQPDLLKVTVRMGDGSYQVFLQPLDADFRVGDGVRVGGGVLQRY